MRIQIGIDDTDHVAFFCADCHSVLQVKKVETRKVGKDKCTWVHCSCPRCGPIVGWRKFYWKEAEGQYCRHRTWV